jgi:DNA-binding CsgD family transcriptional regulator
MSGVPAMGHIGKTFRQVFGREAQDFEAAFHGVFGTGSSLSNFEFAAQLPATMKPGRWLVNFYPIRDESGRVRLIATTFSEATRRSSLEHRLCQLTDKLRADDSCAPSLRGEEFAELSARSLELVKRSLELIKSSMTLRCYVSETRIEAGLTRLASFLTLAQGQRSISHPARRQGGSEVDRSCHRGVPDKSKLRASGPSPRERQIVGLLAEGKSNKEMAAILNLSTRTVEAYRARVMAKLNLHSVAELVRYAVRNNFTQA